MKTETKHTRLRDTHSSPDQMRLVNVCPYSGQPVQFVQPKFDGWRMGIARRGESLIAVGRSGLTFSSVTTLPCIASWIGNLRDGDVIDGELVLSGQGPSRILSSLGKAAAAKAFRFVAFAATGPSFESMDALDVLGTLRGMGIEAASTVALSTPTSLGAGELEAIFRQVVCHERDVEGLVLKQDLHGGWFKVTGVWLIDAVVVDVAGDTLRVSIGNRSMLVEANRVNAQAGDVVEFRAWPAAIARDQDGSELVGACTRTRPDKGAHEVTPDDLTRPRLSLALAASEGGAA